MKKLFLILTCIFVANVSSVLADPFSCEDAVTGTCDHFLFGDGSEIRGIIVSGEPGGGYCSISAAAPIGVNCVLEAANCPDPQVQEDGHNEPGVVYCEGCGTEEDGYYSVNEATCCLLYDRPTNPATGQPYC